MTRTIASRTELSTGAVYRRLARNSAYLAGGTIISALFMMIATVLGARALPTREFGLLVLFQSATWMMTSIMSFSTQQPVIKLGAVALADHDMTRLGRIIGLGLLVDTGAAVLAATVAMAFLAVSHEWLGIGRAEIGVAALFAASLLFTGFATSNGIFRLLDRFGLLSLIQSGCAAGIMVASGCLYLAHAPFSAFCWAWAILFALNSQIPLITALVLTRRAQIPVGFAVGSMHRDEVRTFFAYCWTTWGIATAESLRSNGDSLLVGATVSVEAAGVYNVTKQLAGVLRKLNTVYASVAFPEISALSAGGHHRSGAHIRLRMLWLGALVGAIAVVAALLFGRFVLGVLFGPRFAAGYLPLAILTAAAAAQLITHTLSMYQQVYLGPESLLRLYVLATAVFLVTAAPLTFALSISGTAIAQLLFSAALIGLLMKQQGGDPRMRQHEPGQDEEDLIGDNHSAGSLR